MIFALNENREKILPIKGVNSVCPFCEQRVVAKMGLINVHHWAHENNVDCPFKKENETEWHIKWKSYFNSGSVEVPIKNGELLAYADLRLNNNSSVEFQKSNISPYDIAKREYIHENITWVLDMTYISDNRISFYRKQNASYKDREYTFAFKWPRKHYATMTNKILDIDDPDDMFHVTWNNKDFSRCRGVFINRDLFIKRLISMQLHPNAAQTGV